MTVYKQLLTVCGEDEVFTLDLMIFNRTEIEKKKMNVTDVDLIVKARLARLRFIFLKVWLSRLMVSSLDFIYFHCFYFTDVISLA